MLFAVLRSADEHLHQVIVQAVEDLALEGPLELRVVEIARMQLEVIGVDAGSVNRGRMMSSTASPLARASNSTSGCS